MRDEEKVTYTAEDREEVIANDDNSGAIIAEGEGYYPFYGVNWFYITDKDIEQLKAGKMFYTSDGEYAYCLVYKEENEN